MPVYPNLRAAVLYNSDTRHLQIHSAPEKIDNESDVFGSTIDAQRRGEMDTKQGRGKTNGAFSPRTIKPPIANRILNRIHIVQLKHNISINSPKRSKFNKITNKYK